MADSNDVPLEWPEPSDNTVSLFLSLYLLLLAFFIVLNTISETRDARVAKAVYSVKETFQDYSPPSQEILESAANPDSMIASEVYLEDVRNVFSAHLKNAKFQKKTDGTLLRTIVPAEELFESGSARLTPATGTLMDAIANGLGTSRVGTRREIEMLIGSGEKLPDVDDLGRVLEIRRSSAFSRALRARGVAGNSISSGVRAGDPNTVEITFYVRRLGATNVTFENGTE